MDYNQVMSMTFDTVEDAEFFYIIYARAMGFGVRKSDMKFYEDGSARYRKWYCCKQGEREDRWLNMENRKRQPKAITRVNCNACFRIKYDKSIEKFVVTEFSREHTHPLASPSAVPFLR
ncbi:hypothetical protein ACH5RR_014654 [Cinchona calisaya]|uniref:FAR1 domain-containing protein n=1 Tax=Cinchona calisaya TaxID=153742 RepID=A0ABD2ZUG1_9GENT